MAKRARKTAKSKSKPKGRLKSPGKPATLLDAVRALSTKSIEELEWELGRRVELTLREVDRSRLSVAAASPPKPPRDFEMNAATDFLKEVGGRFLRNLSAQFYRLICDDKDPENLQLQNYAANQIDIAAKATALWLVSNLGMLPGLATVVGLWLAKRFGSAGREALCETWKRRLPRPEPVAGSEPRQG